MLDFAEIKNVMVNAEERFAALTAALHIVEKRAALLEIDAQIAAPDFWQNADRAQKIVAQRKLLSAVVDPFSTAEKNFRDNVDLWELAHVENDKSTLTEIAALLLAIPNELRELDNMALLSGEHDTRDAYFSIHTGAGGSDACEWAEMLLRMYSRFFERHNWQAEILSLVEGEEAGIRGVDLRVSGEYAYGKLRGEMGVHRLVRISPFSGRRETSFAAVDVIPDFQEAVNIDVAEKDLRIDTYRAGGKGGQHVNKTDSAVRITHLPTGIVVAAQNERSQHSNKAAAMRALKSRLMQLEETKRMHLADEHNAQKMDNAWGSQIRNYVMNPYTLVKDTRTDEQTGNLQAALDGNIDNFIDAYLRFRAAQKNQI